MGRSRSRSRSYSPRRGREPSPVRREPPTRCSLLLRNLSKGITIDDLRHYADKYGKVRDIYIPRDYYSGESRGIGFVEYWDPRDAEDAKYAMQGLMLDGRELNVMFAMQGRKRPEDYRKLGFSERRSGYDRGGYERGGYDRGGYDRGGYDRDRGGYRGDRGRDDYRGGGGSDYRRDRERDVSRSPRGRGRSRSPRRRSPSRSPAHGKDVRRSRSRSRDRRGSPAPNNNGHHSHSPVRSRSPPQRQPSGSPPRSRSRSVSPRD